MALSTDVKLKILYHLSFPATSLTVGNVNFNSVIRDRLEIADSAISDQIEGIVLELDAAETYIKEAVKCLKVESVDNIRMNKDNIHNAKKEYARLLKKLSLSLDLPSNSISSNIGVSI